MRRVFAALALAGALASFVPPAAAQAAGDVVRAVAAQRLALRSLASQIAVEEGVDVTLAHALIARESGWQIHVVGRAGEIGLTQIKLPTARLMGFRGTRAQLFDPATNLRFGMKYAARAIRHGGIRFYRTGF